MTNRDQQLREILEDVNRCLRKMDEMRARPVPGPPPKKTLLWRIRVAWLKLRARWCMARMRRFHRRVDRMIESERRARGMR